MAATADREANIVGKTLFEKIWAAHGVRELPDTNVDAIFGLVDDTPGLTATVDLPAQTIVFHAPSPITVTFEIDPGARRQQIDGLDDIDLTLAYEADISRFETNVDPLCPGQ